MALIIFLRGLESDIKTIHGEAQVSHGKNDKGKGKSKTLLDKIHAFDTQQKHKLQCNLSARGCFVALLEGYVNKANAKLAVELSKPVLRALTEPSISMMKQIFTQVNNLYGDKFGDDSQANLAGDDRGAPTGN